MKTFIRLLLAGILSTGTAQAEMINFTLTGVVDYARYYDNGNLFNAYYAPNADDIVVGDTVIATTTFDNSLINAIGPTTVGVDITIQVGSTSYTNIDELYNSPALTFYNGYFTGLIFDSTNNGFDTNFSGIPGDYILDFAGKTQNGIYLTYEGHWNSIDIAAVPVPPAVWLFGSGLIGLVAVARRKTI